MEEFKYDNPLKMQLLSEFILRFKENNELHLSREIEKLIELFKNNINNLSTADAQVIYDLERDYLQTKKDKENRDPLNELRTDKLKKAFLKYRGLVFDVKTRFDYTSPQVAIQDTLDIAEYAREMLEEIYHDLKESHRFNLPSEKQQVLLRINDQLSSLYSKISRATLRDNYLVMGEILSDFSYIMDNE